MVQDFVHEQLLFSGALLADNVKSGVERVAFGETGAGFCSRYCATFLAKKSLLGRRSISIIIAWRTPLAISCYMKLHEVINCRYWLFSQTCCLCRKFTTGWYVLPAH